MGAVKVLEVTYEINAHTKERSRFQVPKRVCDALGVGPLDEVWVEVTSAGGVTPPTKTKLKSGTEIYGDGLAHCCEPNERIRLKTARRESAPEPRKRLDRCDRMGCRHGLQAVHAYPPRQDPAIKNVWLNNH